MLILFKYLVNIVQTVDEIYTKRYKNQKKVYNSSSVMKEKNDKGNRYI